MGKSDQQKLQTKSSNPSFISLFLFAVVGSLLPGFTTGNCSGDIITLMCMQVYKLPFEQAQAKYQPIIVFLNSSVLIGSIILTVVYSFIARRFGFKITGIIGASGSIITVIMQCIPVNEYYFLMARIIQGFFMTMYMISVLALLAEYANPNQRGMLLYIFQVFFTVGILAATIIFYLIKLFQEKINLWYISYITTIPWPIIGLLYFIKYPEPKREQKEISFTQIFKKQYAKLIPPCLMSGILQQSTGINAVITYASQTFSIIFKDQKLAPVYGSLVINTINFISPLFGLFFIEKYGRKFLYFAGTSLCIIGQFMLLFNYCLPVENSALLITGAVIFIFGFEIGPGPIFYVYSAELFPEIAKSTFMSLFFFFNFLPNIFVIILFPILTNVAKFAPFLSYIIAMCIFSAVLVFYLPETKGKTNEEIKELMVGEKTKLENIEPLITFMGFIVLALLLSITVVVAQMPDVF